MTKNKVLVFSIALEGYSGLFKPCIKTQREYCEKHGYKYILIDRTPRTLLPTEAAWLKLFLLCEALKCKYEWVSFIDADCEIRPHTPPFHQELKEYHAQKIFMSHGFSGRINSGVIFMKKSKEASNYLEEVIKNGDKPVPEIDKAPYENGHMIAYGKDNPDIKILDAVKWNNNSDLNKQSYIQHYSGGPLRRKYLETNSLPWFIFKQRKRLWNLKNRFVKKSTSTSMTKINSLMEFYKKEYPEMFC